MTTQKVLTVFLASPGEANGVRVKVIGWDTDARPGWGKDGQAFINELIEGQKHALFVVLFWNRFGTPTPRAKSGTLEEFQLAVKQRAQSRTKRPEIMLYFNEAPARLRTLKEHEQAAEVLKFKESIKQGLYGTYKGKTDFEKKFRKHYGRWLTEEIGLLPKKPNEARPPETTAGTSTTRKPPAAPPNSPAPKSVKPKAPPVKSSTRKRVILLGDHVFRAGEVKENGTIWTVVVKPQNSDDENRIRALCSSQNLHTRFPLTYQWQGGTASIVM